MDKMTQEINNWIRLRAGREVVERDDAADDDEQATNKQMNNWIRLRAGKTVAEKEREQWHRQPQR